MDGAGGVGGSSGSNSTGSPGGAVDSDSGASEAAGAAAAAAASAANATQTSTASVDAAPGKVGVASAAINAAATVASSISPAIGVAVAGFQAAAAQPAVQAALQKIGFTPAQPPTPADLLDRLTSYPNQVTTPDLQGMQALQANINSYLDGVKAAAEALPDATPVAVALAQNTAIKNVYAALALEMPDFQWTAVGAFTAQQVRTNMEAIGSYHMTPGWNAFMSGLELGGLPTGLPREMVGTLIAGQRTVVTDVGSYALAARAFGAEAVSRHAPDPAMADAFALQARADQARVAGDLPTAADLGRQAAIGIGIVEQQRLQPMWDSQPLSRYAGAIGANVDTTIRTAIGDIPSPPIPGGLRNITNRIGIAQNAFNYMHDHVFTPSAVSARNAAIIRDYAQQTWSGGAVGWGDIGGR